MKADYADGADKIVEGSQIGADDADKIAG